MSDHPTEQKQVDVANVPEGWQVTVRENDEEAVVTFDVEQHAQSFAAGQRVRLRVDPKR